MTFQFRKQYFLLFHFFWLTATIFAQSDTTPNDTIPDAAATIDLPIITLTDGDLEDNQDEGVSGLLSASKDVFVAITDFNFNAVRFRLRGYNSENVDLYFNGIPTNDLESGWAGWSNWSGLNDVTRRKETNVNMEAIGYTFGGVGGAVHIDTRAASQRKQLRLTLSNGTNGNYNHRAMLTWSTGMLSSGWAVTLSASRRWAQEGYIEGTFFDGYSYFASIDKKLNDKHSLNLVLLGAPNKRGKAGATTQEMYDLAGSNYYNPYWGYQNGEKRNSRVATRHQPMALLRHDWTINDNATLTTSVNFQKGRNGSTTLDWYNANDPRPDYYRKLPSFVTSENQRLELERLLSTSEEARQINWHSFYEVNRNSEETIENVDGIEGNDVTGLRSKYIVMERRYDPQVFNFNTNLSYVLSDNVSLSGGLTYQAYKGENYQLVEDLLGGDFYPDIDKFAERDLQGNVDATQSNLDTPNRLVREGDRFGYDYNSNVNKASAWGQAEFTIKKLGVHVAASASNTRFWRTGNYRNGKFPDSSFGDSEKQNFFNYGVKGGLNYAINGRNYVYANGAYMTRAPFFRDAYVSPRTRNEAVPNLTSEKILSGELAYVLTTPIIKARIGGYFTQFNDRLETRSFYHDAILPNGEDLVGSFVNYIMSDVDKQHIGLEIGARAKLDMLIAGLSAEAAANLGQYTYTSRPNALIIVDNSATIAGQRDAIYLKNFYESGTPQTAYTVGLQYETSNYLTANIRFNYFDNTWIDVNPDRRTLATVGVSQNEELLQPGTELWESILYQEKAPAEYTMDVSLRKSFKVKNNFFINVNLSVNNILNNTNLVRDGFEQLRFDYDQDAAEIDANRFPSKYYYARGINYFVTVSFSYR